MQSSQKSMARAQQRANVQKRGMEAGAVSLLFATGAGAVRRFD